MCTESAPPRGRGGFTLIEVLVAMVILAIGLLGVEALGIGASRTINRADRMQQYLGVASDSLEAVRSRVATSAVVPIAFSRTNNLPDNARVRVGLTNPTTGLWNVSVTVYPPSTSSLLKQSDSIRVEANVFRQ